MFENWGFLLGEMRGLLALAAALGLGAGWLIWGGRAVPPAAGTDPETARLRAALEAEGQRARTLEARLAALEAVPAVAAADPVAPTAEAAAPPEGASGGAADDLTRIRGIGPKLAAMLDGLGVRRFEQIAGWSEADVVRIDARLGGFRGRAARDGWVEQARRILAERDA